MRKRQHPLRLAFTVGHLTFVAPLALAAVPEFVAGVRCVDIPRLGIDKQDNVLAGYILKECGWYADLEGDPAQAGEPGRFQPQHELQLGNHLHRNDVDVITGDEAYPLVTQSESMVAKYGNTIVVNYNDFASAPDNYSGVSVSVNGGWTFTRLLPSPFATGHGRNAGDPILVFNEARQTWFAGYLAGSDCGRQGIGLWTSTDGLHWTPGQCAHSSFNDDRESMSVDNNPGSSTYGRMYISYNDFGHARQIFVTHSDDGAQWSTPVQVTSNFIRNVQLTVPPDGNATVFLAAMDEMGGQATRQNLIYRSTDGGQTWTLVYTGLPFLAPGAPGCGYFWRIPRVWRHMGWGQPAAGPNGYIHYAYSGQGVAGPTDLGDIYYIRSTDNGDSWSEPVVLNTDSFVGGTREQWMPSVSVTPGGDVLVTWYDRRNTADLADAFSYELFGRESPNNGDRWLLDGSISDVISPEPLQPDFNPQGCYAGDYNNLSAAGALHLVTWTDGRVRINGVSQQDVFFEAVPSAQLR